MVPKVSVVVPVYNAADFLPRTLDALKAQTLSETEFILVNDGSTDDSEQICRSYAEKDSRFTVLCQENKGVCAARNAGIDAARGDYVGFCDSDDIPDNDLYQTLYELITREQAQLAMADVRIKLPDGSIKHTASGVDHCWNKPEDFAKDFFSQYLNIGVYTKLFRRDLLSGLRFDETRKINEDLFFFFCAGISSAKTVHRSIEKYTYIKNSTSTTLGTFSEKFFDSRYFANELVRITKVRFPQLTDSAEGKRLSILLRLLNRMIILGGDRKFKAEYKEISADITSHTPAFCKKYLRKNDYFRYSLLKRCPPLFKLVTKTLDKY